MEELYKFKDRNEYVKALDSVMPDKFVMKRDIPSGVHKYLPMAIKEAVADNIFQYWNIIDEKYTIIANELIATIKIVFVPAYPSADELFCTGSASVPIQMDKGGKISDFPNNKKRNALEYNLPSVRSEAASNALGTLGNIFGRNLSRKLSPNNSLPVDFSFRKHTETKE